MLAKSARICYTYNMNKLVVITGGSSGIGKALAEKFTLAGDRVVCCQRSGEGDNFVKCDVTDTESVLAAARVIGERYGTPDIIINNAGIGITGATELIPMTNIRRAMDISYYGALAFTRAMLPLMKRGGRIIFISSVAGLFALPFRSVYCSVKSAELMLGESLRMELLGTGIDVITLCPGEIKTNFTANKLTDVATNERYGDRVAAALDKVNSREEKRMPIASVADKLYRICDRGRKPMYIIGFKYKVFWLGKRILPTSLFLRLTNKFLG